MRIHNHLKHIKLLQILMLSLTTREKDSAMRCLELNLKHPNDIFGFL